MLSESKIKNWIKLHFTFTFLVEAFIQSVCSLRIKPTALVLLAACSLSYKNAIYLNTHTNTFYSVNLTESKLSNFIFKELCWHDFYLFLFVEYCQCVKIHHKKVK